MSKEYEEKRGPRGADDHTEKRFPRERRAEERVPMRERDAGADGLIEGRNAVTEALRAGTPAPTPTVRAVMTSEECEVALDSAPESSLLTPASRIAFIIASISVELPKLWFVLSPHCGRYSLAPVSSKFPVESTRLAEAALPAEVSAPPSTASRKSPNR